MNNNIKRFLEEDIYFYAALIVLVGILSFGLGRLSVLTTTVPRTGSITMTKQPQAALALPVGSSSEAAVATLQLVASKKGTKYHLLTCPGAKQISEENKIYFTTTAEAQSKGYTPAANCKELQ